MTAPALLFSLLGGGQLATVSGTYTPQGEEDAAVNVHSPSKGTPISSMGKKQTEAWYNAQQACDPEGTAVV